METLKIKAARVWKTGSGSKVVTIPEAFFKNELIDADGYYDIEIRPSC